MDLVFVNLEFVKKVKHAWFVCANRKGNFFRIYMWSFIVIYCPDSLWSKPQSNKRYRSDCVNILVTNIFLIIFMNKNRQLYAAFYSWKEVWRMEKRFFEYENSLRCSWKSLTWSWSCLFICSRSVNKAYTYATRWGCNFKQ